jgi:drug/metabolite transporter (DMT)-like permease
VLGLVLALGSSLCWGVSDFLGGLQARRLPLLRVMLVTQAVGLVGLGALLAVRGVPAPALHRLAPAFGAGVAGLIALTSFYRGLAIGTMSIVAPISATGVAVPVLVGIAGGERPAALQIVGIIAAGVGVVLASREAGPGVVATPQARASLGLALVAALGFGLFFVGLRSGARADAWWAAFTARSASTLLLCVAALGAPSARRGGIRELPPLVLIGVLDVGANLLFALASRHGLLSVVSVLASLYPLATVLLARAILGERVRRVQEVGIVAALVGVLLIAAG